jgi:hypothetical protein
MGQIDCPETLVTYYQPTLRNIPEERRSQYFASSFSTLHFLEGRGYLSLHAVMTSIINYGKCGNSRVEI